MCYNCDIGCSECTASNNCSECNYGYYLEENICKTCIEHCNTCNNNASCTSCNENYSYVIINNTCTL